MNSKFGNRIEELRKKQNKTQDYIVKNIVNENGFPVISSLSAYRKLIAGDRKSPRNFDEILAALANYYNVTTDYLLGLEKVPRHAASINESTGLSNESAKILMDYKKDNPEIIKMMDALISGSSSGKPVPDALFEQFFNDYAALKRNAAELESKEHDALILEMYSSFRKTAFEKLSHEFEKLLRESDQRMHEKMKSIAMNDSINMADSDPEYKKYLRDSLFQNRQRDEISSKYDGKLFHNSMKNGNLDTK